MFWTKKRQKNGVFFGVFMSELKRFGFLLYISNDIRTHKIVVYLDAQGGCCNNKTDNFSEKKKAFGPKKRQKKVFSGVFRQCTTKTLRNFAALIRLRSNLQDNRPRQLGRFQNRIWGTKIYFFLFLPLPTFQGLAGLDFGSVLFQLTFHSRNFAVLLSLR